MLKRRIRSRLMKGLVLEEEMDGRWSEGSVQGLIWEIVLVIVVVEGVTLFLRAEI